MSTIHLRLPMVIKLVLALIPCLVMARTVSGQCLFSDEQKVVASDAGPGANLGQAVAVDGGFVVAGAPFDNGAGSGAGAAYVYQFQNSVWVEMQKLTASDAEANAGFGSSVGISRDVLVVGAPLATGMAFQSGAAYVFRLQGNTWVEEQKLMSADAGTADRFGASVTVDRDALVVGAPEHDEGAGNAGAAYVYRGPGWALEQKLLALDPAPAAQLGTSVSVSGDRVLAGAPFAVVGNITPGAAYVFLRSGTWAQEAKLTRTGGLPDDRLGQSVSLDGAIALVGVPLYDFESDEGVQLLNSGAAVVYKDLGFGWVERQLLVLLVQDEPPDNTELAWAGSSVAVAGTVALVGAPFYSQNLANAGAVYSYLDTGAGWVLVERLDAPGFDFGDQFGTSVALSGPVGAVGVSMDSDAASTAGSAVVYTGAFPGAVDVGLAEVPTDVLLVNGSSGGAGRTVTVNVGDPITVDLLAAPGGPASQADYVVWVWRGLIVQPFPLNVGTSTLGCTVSPTPIQPFAGPQPALCLASDNPTLQGFCGAVQIVSSPPTAPFSVTKPQGLGQPLTFLLQGVLEDLGSASLDGFSVTNAVILTAE